jgi:NADH-quinone oxidoreductase subunit N
MISVTSMPWLAPEILLVFIAAILLVLELVYRLSSRSVGYAAIASVVGLMILTAFIPVLGPDGGDRHFFWSNTYLWDGPAKFYKIFFLIATAFVLWMILESEGEGDSHRPEFYVLTLLTSAGMCLLASVQDFMLLFVALELVTISFYILVAYQRASLASLEAGVKYLILGGVSSAFLVMGIAYVFGMTGSTHFSAVPATFKEGGLSNVGLLFGVLFILVGLGFKVSSVPFHFWAPDVYQGAPTPMTAFLSVGSKAAGFVLLLRIFAEGARMPSNLQTFVEITAIASMLLGNLAAIPQRNLKRMLAYSSIGHSGFMLIAVAGLMFQSQMASASSVALGVYLLTYLIATMLAFLVIVVVSHKIPGEQIHTYAGLGQRSPLLAGGLAIGLVSMAGVPPLVGFIGKLSVFVIAWNLAFTTSTGSLGVVVLAAAVFAAVAALYYYLSLLKVMFWSEPLDRTPIPVAPGTKIMILALCFLSLLLGFWAGGLAWATAGLGIK